VQMLEKNSRIEYVEVIVGERHKEHLADLKLQHLRPIRSWDRLAVENKIAFLSVLSRNPESGADFKKRRKQSSVRAALYETDRHVLAHILAFADSHSQREVHVRWQSEGGIDEEEDYD